MMNHIISFIFVLLCGVYTAPALAIDILSLGKPIDNDLKEMKDRLVYLDADVADPSVALDRPIFSTSEIDEWVQQSVAEVLNLDGETYDSQTALSKRFFTEQGYTEYTASLISASLPVLLKEQGYALSAVVLQRPEITAQGLRDIAPKIQSAGAAQSAPSIFQYVWQVNVPVVLTYTKIQEIMTYDILVNTEIVRVLGRQDDQKIAMNIWRFQPIVKQEAEPKKNLLPSGNELPIKKSGSRFAF